MYDLNTSAFTLWPFTDERRSTLLFFIMKPFPGFSLVTAAKNLYAFQHSANRVKCPNYDSPLSKSEIVTQSLRAHSPERSCASRKTFFGLFAQLMRKLSIAIALDFQSCLPALPCLRTHRGPKHRPGRTRIFKPRSSDLAMVCSHSVSFAPARCRSFFLTVCHFVEAA